MKNAGHNLSLQDHLLFSVPFACTEFGKKKSFCPISSLGLEQAAECLENYN